jgi:cytochrome c2
MQNAVGQPPSESSPADRDGKPVITHLVPSTSLSVVAKRPAKRDETTPLAVSIAALATILIASGVIGAQAWVRSGDHRDRDAAEASAPANRELGTPAAQDPVKTQAVRFLVEHGGRPGWPTSQPAPLVTGPALSASASAGLKMPLVKAGAAAFTRFGCVACHTTDAKPGVGPSLANIVGSHVTLASGAIVIADTDFLRESIRQPSAKVHKGFTPVMPDFGSQIKDREVDALIEFMKSISPDPAKRVETPQLQPAPKPS